MLANFSGLTTSRILIQLKTLRSTEGTTDEAMDFFPRVLLVTPRRNPEFLPICVFPVAFRVVPSETAKKSLNGDLVTYASYGFGEEWLHDNS
jgi:hypothetical protein